MNLSICVVNWEGGEVFKECLNSIISNCRDIKLLNYEIIIVDNASTKFDINYLKQLDSRIKIYINESNLLFSKATNQSINYSKGNLILILNNDIVLKKNFLKNILKEKNLYDAVSPQLVYPNGTIQKTITGLPTLKDIFYTSIGINHISNKYDNWLLNHFDYYTKQIVTGQPCFSALLIKRETWKIVGELDEKFPLLWNDTDWFFRFQKKGLKCLYLPDAKAEHIHGMSVNKHRFNKIKNSTISMKNYFVKNKKMNIFTLLFLNTLCIYTFIIRVLREFLIVAKNKLSKRF